MNEEVEIIMSSLSQKISSGGKTIQVDIYHGGDNCWVLEVVDEFNNSTVWDDSFETDSEALTEVKKVILAEGVDALIGSETTEAGSEL
jgi:hypothetical protein